MKRSLLIISMLLIVVSLSAQSAAELKNGAIAKYKAKDLAGSLEQYEKYVAADEAIAMADFASLYNMGTIARKLKMYDKALKYYQLTADGGYKGENSYYYMISVCKSLKDQDGRLENINKALELYPNSKNIKKAAASYYGSIASASFGKAQSEFNKAVSGVGTVYKDTEDPKYVSKLASIKTLISGVKGDVSKVLEYDPASKTAASITAAIKSIEANL